MSTRRPSSRRRASLLGSLLSVLALVALAGCSGQKQPTSYDKEFKENFMLGCTGVDEPLASKSQCECIYKGLESKVDFDDAKAFEEQQEQAESGDDIKVPDNIAKVAEDCKDA